MPASICTLEACVFSEDTWCDICKIQVPLTTCYSFLYWATILMKSWRTWHPLRITRSWEQEKWDVRSNESYWMTQATWRDVSDVRLWKKRCPKGAQRKYPMLWPSSICKCSKCLQMTSKGLSRDNLLHQALLGEETLCMSCVGMFVHLICTSNHTIICHDE